MLAVGISAQAASNVGFLNVPTPQSFNDRSALTDKANLQSQQYQDFIHTLYRFDKDNLKRVDNLFAHPERASQQTSQSQQPNKQPTYADYIQTQPNYFGFPNSGRYKRGANGGVIFRPLFVTRIFQERARQREEDRLRRRLLAKNYSKHAPKPISTTAFLKNRLEYVEQ